MPLIGIAYLITSYVIFTRGKHKSWADER